MDAEHGKEYEPKGRYYKFETTSRGSVVLKPVKVPAHILAERKARMRRQEIARRVEDNRQRAASMNIGFVMFMALAIAICAIVCYFYISLQGQVSSRMLAVSTVEQQLEEVMADNDAFEQRLNVGQDLNLIKQRAQEELGMRAVEEENIIYYDVNETDYMLQYQDIEE